MTARAGRRYRVTHRTEYHYGEPVAVSHAAAPACPAPTCRTSER